MANDSAPNGLPRLAAIAAGINYKDWCLVVRLDDGGRPYLQWQFIAQHATTAKYSQQHGRKWFLSYHMTESEVVFTALKAAVTAEEHECRERFTYGGYRIFNPHVSVHALMEICHREDVRT